MSHGRGGVSHPLALLREALAGARSQAVASVLTAVTVAGMCAAVLLTTGRTVAAEQAVLAELDAVGTRGIIVRADTDAGVTARLLDQLRPVTGVEAVAGFGPIEDARNAAIPDGPRVPVRRGYGVVGQQVLTAPPPAGTEVGVLASPVAARAAGLRDGFGGLRTDTGTGMAVVGNIDVPAHLKFLEPLVVLPSSTPQALAGSDPDAPLAVVVVLAASPPEVAAVEAVVRSMLRPPQDATVTVETSAQLAAIRAAIGGQLGTYGRDTVLGIIAVTAALVAVVLLGLVTLRRKDFGRRRALGARQSLIVQLLLVQVAVLGAVGAAAGIATALSWLAVADNPLPGLSFVTAVGLTGVITATAAGVIPALIAARRDPLHELRVP